MTAPAECSRISDEAEAPPETVKKESRLLRFLRNPLLWVLAAAFPFFIADLGTPYLSDGEAMFAEIAREMRMSGDWITPRLNGARHFDKPPLVYWVVGLSQQILGEREVSARIWMGLASLATILVVGWIGRTLYGKRAGWLSALVYAASLGPYLFGRMVMPEPFLCLSVALSILGYLRGYGEDPRGQGWWPWVMFASLGFAALAKGLLGFGLPTAVIGLHMLLSGRFKAFFSWRFAVGACVTAAVAAPWHIAAARANPDFLWYFFVREHLLRFTGQRYPADEFVSFPVYLILTLVWTFPWLPLIPQALKQAFLRLSSETMKKGKDLLPLIWIFFIVGFFSASRSRLEYYALPSIPAFALIIGKLWDDLFSGEPGGPSRKGGEIALGSMAVVIGAVAVVAFIALGPGKEMVFQAFALWWPEGGWGMGPEHAAILEKIRVPTLVALGGAAICAAGALAAVRRSRLRLACGLLAGMMVPVFILAHWGFCVVEPYQSSRAVAEILDRSARPDFVVYQEPYEFMWIGGITYYSNRMIYVLKDPRFEGLAVKRREPPERYLDKDRLLALWNSGKRIAVVLDESKKDLMAALSDARPAEVLGRSGNMVVLGVGYPPKETPAAQATSSKKN